LIVALSNLESVRVVARTSAFSFKGTIGTSARSPTRWAWIVAKWNAGRRFVLNSNPLADQRRSLSVSDRATLLQRRSAGEDRADDGR
jgi:hypothetical protein